MRSPHVRLLGVVALFAACGDDSGDKDPEVVEDGGGISHRDAGTSNLDAGGRSSIDASANDAALQVADAGVDAGEAPATTLKLVTYNVAGLPQGISQSNPATNSALISPLLNDYALAMLQEDFTYHPQIVSASTHPYPSPPDTRGQSVGDGLTFLSNYPLRDFERVAWTDCNGVLDSGSDCLTPKGFAFARFDLGNGAMVDVYDAHTDAGSTPNDIAARTKNTAQLAAAIAARSSGHAVIVAGDLNARYSSVGDDSIETLVDSAQLRDMWVEFVNHGARPQSGMPVTCSTTDANDPACERIDKVLVRNGGGVRFEPIAYSVEGAKFVDAMGAQLSDHRPVTVTLRID